MARAHEQLEAGEVEDAGNGKVKLPGGNFVTAKALGHTDKAAYESYMESDFRKAILLGSVHPDVEALCARSGGGAAPNTGVSWQRAASSARILPRW